MSAVQVTPFSEEEMKAAAITLDKRIIEWFHRTKNNGVPTSTPEVRYIVGLELQCELNRVESVVLRLADKIIAQRESVGLK